MVLKINFVQLLFKNGVFATSMQEIQFHDGGKIYGNFGNKFSWDFS